MTEELAERATCPAIAIPNSPLRTSLELDKFAEAFSAAQGEFENPEKSKTATVRTRGGDDYSYQYADIADGLSEARLKLSKYKLFFTQITVIDGEHMNLVTRICHVSGQWIEGDYPVCRIHEQHQDMGGKLTYAKRQALFSMLGIAGEDDRDEVQTAPTPAPAKKTQTSGSETTRMKAKPFAPRESGEWADKMLASLAATTTREDVQKWAMEHSSIKAHLLPNDAERVNTRFLEHQRSLKQPK